MKENSFEIYFPRSWNHIKSTKFLFARGILLQNIIKTWIINMYQLGVEIEIK